MFILSFVQLLVKYFVYHKGLNRGRLSNLGDITAINMC